MELHEKDRCGIILASYIRSFKEKAYQAFKWSAYPGKHTRRKTYTKIKKISLKIFFPEFLEEPLWVMLLGSCMPNFMETARLEIVKNQRNYRLE